MRSIHMDQVCEPHMTWAPKVFDLSGVKWSQAKKQFIAFPLYKPWGSQWNTTVKIIILYPIGFEGSPFRKWGVSFTSSLVLPGFPFKQNLWVMIPSSTKHTKQMWLSLYGGFEDALRVLNKCVNLNSVEMLVGDRNPPSIFLMGC